MTRQIKAVLLVASVITAMFSLSGCNTTAGSISNDQVSDRTYPTSVESTAVINPSEITVAFRVKNDGTTPIEPSCIIKATDGTGTYKGVYMGVQESIPAGVSQRLVAALEISNEGAEYATKITAECSARTSDTEVSTGQQIQVSDVSDCGGDDGETWYWAACFKVDAAPKTMMNCTVDALNGSGEIVATLKDTFNTLNDGTAVGYGDGAGSRDTTKQIYQSIKSLEVSCSL